MLDDGGNAALQERWLLSAIDSVDKKILHLQEQKTRLQEQLYELKQQNISIRDVTRKNSLGRIMLEFKILEMLRQNEKPMLLSRIVKSLPEYKASTVRVQLFRLREKGLVDNPRRGQWGLA